MAATAHFPIVLQQTFIEATRDTGYRNTAAAVAELVDNAIQAKAKNIRIFVDDEGDDDIMVAVLDDGCGMDTITLRRALQFGGSMRFGDRSGLGRFGMGLPNASVSQAKHVDVFTWRAPNACIASHLDVDDIVAGHVHEIPTVQRSSLPRWAHALRSFSGTLVIWTKCDRLDNRRASTVARKLHEPIGRVFRHFLWAGVRIWINDEPVSATDPLFLHPSSPLQGAVSFGDPLTFEVRIPGKPGRTSEISVRFAELPVAEWHNLSVEDKRKYRIVDAAGLSILRAGREVDYGWWFFGGKRRENYDSWWRGELSFGPELDELFSITHSKQGINPTLQLREILTPDLESVARQLNSRVQAAFASVKSTMPESTSAATLREQPRTPVRAPAPKQMRTGASEKENSSRSVPLPEATADDRRFRVSVERLRADQFFRAKLTSGRWTLVINNEHPFYRKVYAPLCGAANTSMRLGIERILLAYAMVEAANGTSKSSSAHSFRADWATELAELLGDEG